MDQITIFTDGSSKGNPGPGGFGAIVIFEGEVAELGGREEHTTNNRMEMAAVIAGLAWIRKNVPEVQECTVYSDSSLVIQTLLQGWKRKKNLDLWEKIDNVRKEFKKISWEWVRGHNGHPQNTEADSVAVKEAKRYQRMGKEAPTSFEV